LAVVAAGVAGPAAAGFGAVLAGGFGAGGLLAGVWMGLEAPETICAPDGPPEMAVAVSWPLFNCQRTVLLLFLAKIRVIGLDQT